MPTDPRRHCCFILFPSSPSPFVRTLARLIPVALLAVVGSTFAAAAAPSLAHLRCEYKVDPIGIDATQPRLSWELRSDERGVAQTAYQVQVAEGGSSWREEAILWDTGKVVSDRSIHVPYEGRALESGRRYSWRVRVWDDDGRASEWSAPAYWEMGLLRPEGWQARWIAADTEEDVSKPQPAPMLRTTFTIDGTVQSARAYVTSLGLYELEINGTSVGDQLFTPGWTSYSNRLQYQTYDVTDQLRRGENVVGAMLGDGWYRGYMGWGDARNIYGDGLALLFELRITHEDGRVQVVGTDETWRSTTGPDSPLGHLHGRDLRRPARAARLDCAGLRRQRLGGASASSIRARASSSLRPGRPFVVSRRSARSRSSRPRPGRRSSTWARTWWGGCASRCEDPRGPVSRSATPRCSTRTATSTSPTFGRRSRRSRTS